MGGTWAKAAGMGIILVAIGCRTPKPELKPATTAEALNAPPAEKRFDTPAYPKEAFNNRDAIRKLNQDQEIVPVGQKLPGSPGFR
jgi:hypothetical protein